MSETDELRKVAREWVNKAENDFKSAEYLLKMGKDCPTDTICFHVQQCVEKYLKAFLVSRGTDFPKTHDTKELIALLPAGLRPKLTPKEQRRLTDYATVTRYPGDYEEIPLAETKKAIGTARRVRTEVRKRLPKGMLQAEK